MAHILIYYRYILKGKFNEEITVEKVKQLLVGLNYKEVVDSGPVNYHDNVNENGDSMMLLQATGPYQYLMYMRCLALQLSAINSVSTGDVVIIINIIFILIKINIIDTAICHSPPT